MLRLLKNLQQPRNSLLQLQKKLQKTIELIAQGSTEQAKDTEASAANVKDLGRMLEQDAIYLGELNIAAEDIDKKKNEGFDILG